MVAVPTAAMPMTSRQGGSDGQPWEEVESPPTVLPALLPARSSEALSVLSGNRPGRCWQLPWAGVDLAGVWAWSGGGGGIPIL